MSMIEVFKTDVEEAEQASALANLLLQHFPCCSVSFDLEDCDRVLRVEGEGVNVNLIRVIITNSGYSCIPLD